MPTDNGSLWPAFWMSPNQAVYGGWPRSGEIDIVEARTHDSTFAAADAHWGLGDKQKRHLQGRTTTDDIGQWHTYALKWEEGRLEYYLDGRHYSNL